MIVFIGLDSRLGQCSAECGKSYRPYSVAESHRTAQGPRQRTLLTLGPDFRRLGADPLYRVSDDLLCHRERPESRLHERERTLSGVGDMVLLYDLTSTCFEGQAAANPKARRGYSRDKGSEAFSHLRPQALHRTAEIRRRVYPPLSCQWPLNSLTRSDIIHQPAEDSN